MLPAITLVTLRKDWTQEPASLTWHCTVPEQTQPALPGPRCSYLPQEPLGSTAELTRGQGGDHRQKRHLSRTPNRGC